MKRYKLTELVSNGSKSRLKIDPTIIVSSGLYAQGTLFDANTILLNFSSGSVGGSVDLSNYYTKQEVNLKVLLVYNELNNYDLSIENINNRMSEIISDMATKVWVGQQGFLKEHLDISNLVTKEELNSFEFKIPSLSGYATEEWVQDLGYLTEHQSLTEYAKIITVDLKISDAKSEIIGGAPETYNTLKEIADYIEQHKSVETALNEAIGNKVKKSGDTMTGSLYLQSNNDVWVGFSNSSTVKGSIGYDSNGFYIWTNDRINGSTAKIIIGEKLIIPKQIISTIAEGTAPLSVTSTTKVDNLNADMVDGLHGSELFKTLGVNSELNNIADGSNANGITLVSRNLANFQAPFNYGAVLKLGIGEYNGQLGFNYTGDVSYRHQWYKNSGSGFSDWKTIAFTDSTVANAVTVAGHIPIGAGTDAIIKRGYVYSNASLSNYWFPVATIKNPTNGNNTEVTLFINRTYTNTTYARWAVVNIKLRYANNIYNKPEIFILDGNIAKEDFRLYYKDEDTNPELWVTTAGMYSAVQSTVLLEGNLSGNHLTSNVIFNTTYYNTEQTPALTDYVEAKWEVNYATRLLNPRTLWGQSFDGTANVSGNLDQVINIYAHNPSLNNDGYAVYPSYANGEAFRIDSRKNGAFNINLIAALHNGNVGIGTTTPTAKLDVDGNIKTSGHLISTTTTTTDISKVPTTSQMCVVNTSQSGTFGLEGTMTAGTELQVFINNTGSSEITIAIPTTFKSNDLDSISIDPGNYGEINIISDGTNLYLRAI